jgi:hypothetical protein
MFDPSSRYSGLGEAQYQADGRLYVYKQRRFPPLNPPVQGQLRVRDGERLDLVAVQVLGDPLQFWRIADANLAMNPFDLTKPGAVLSIPVAGFLGRTKP